MQAATGKTAEGYRLDALGRGIAWEAQPGPQTFFLQALADEILFGGARGGGKTYGILGDWIQHAGFYGKHARGILFRKTYDEFEEVLDQTHAIFPLLGARYKVQARTWIFSNGASLKLRYLKRDTDASHYQGHAYCVAVGTRVRMADGSLKPIEAIQVGEFVQTLEGPRAVTDTVRPYEAACVRATVYDAAGAYAGEQVQPVWHPLLTTAGLHHGQSGGSRQSEGRSRTEESSPSRPGGRSRPCVDSGTQGWRAYAGDARTDDRAHPCIHSRTVQPPELSFPVVLHVPAPQISQPHAAPDFSRRSGSPDRSAEWSWGLDRPMPSIPTDPRLHDEPARSIQGNDARHLANARACGPGAMHTASGFGVDCPTNNDSHDAPARVCSENDPGHTPSQGDAGAQPHAAPTDATGTIPRHTTHRRTYRHPYTGEARDLAEHCTVGTVSMTPCGTSWVTDLTVDRANHYITESGLINKNTWMGFEELGNWPNAVPIDALKGSLRSAHGVPCRWVATANPGGVGHNWIKARFITPAPAMRCFQDPLTKVWRVFIPSKLQDNPLLAVNDPGYADRLRGVGADWLVEAWLTGNWDIVAGGMFDDLWRADQHVIEPFPIPAGWRIDRAFDWGSSKPFSVGWWAESDGTKAPNGVIYKKGSLFRIGEWYGWNGKKPNEGTKMLAVDIARGIREREQHMKLTIHAGPADPAIFATENGNNIANDMALPPGSIRWEPADAGPGSRKTGWERIRKMMKASTVWPMEDPGLFVFDTCRQFIRTVPSLPRDMKKPDDVDTNAEDHIGDETRYRTMHVRATVKQQKLVGT